MADILKIGFEVDTNQLKKASSDMKSFSQAAKEANSSASNASSSITKSAQRMAAASAGVNKLESSLDMLSRGETEASLQLNKYGVNITKAIRNQQLFEKSTRNLTSALEKQSIAQQALNNASILGPHTGKVSFKIPDFESIPRDMMPNRFNTANIAAQFQDIGVTAAMGMSPLTIALQQGTQLSAILNSMQNPLKGLAQAFQSILNPVSLLSIGFTALVASLIQIVDWVKVGESATLMFADGLLWLADNLEIVSTAMITFLSIQLVTHIGAITGAITGLVTSLYSMAAGWVAAVGPIGWFVIAITGVVTTIYAFKDEIADLIGQDTINNIKTGMNVIITTFKNGIMVIYRGFQLLFQELKNLWAEYLKMMVTFGEKIEIVSSSFTAVFDGGERLAARMKEYQGIRDDIDRVYSGDSKAFENRLGYLMQDVEDPMGSRDYVGMATSAVDGLVDKVKAGLKDAAEALRDGVDGMIKEQREAWEEIVKGIESHKIELMQQADLIGRIGVDYEYTKTRYDLLNQAREADINLTQEQLVYLEKEAMAQATLADEVENLTDRFEFAKSVTGSFFSDLRQGLMEGKNLWESFGDAALNVLDKILDKILSIGVDYVFAGLKMSGLFGSGTQVYDSPIGPTQTAGASGFYGQALGGVWSNGVQKFARGGIVNSPTVFGASNGLGLMGEAGPEAIMPLQRGPDGSLGVRADGVGGGNVVVNVINNSDSQASVNRRETSQGVEIDVMIDQLVAEKMSQPGTSSNSALTAFNNRRLITR